MSACTLRNAQVRAGGQRRHPGGRRQHGRGRVRRRRAGRAGERDVSPSFVLNRRGVRTSTRRCKRALARAQRDQRAWSVGAEGERLVRGRARLRRSLRLDRAARPPLARAAAGEPRPRRARAGRRRSSIDAKNWSGDVSVRDGRLRQNGYDRTSQVESVARAAPTSSPSSHPHTGPQSEGSCAWRVRTSSRRRCPGASWSSGVRSSPRTSSRLRHGCRRSTSPTSAAILARPSRRSRQSGRPTRSRRVTQRSAPAKIARRTSASPRRRPSARWPDVQLVPPEPCRRWRTLPPRAHRGCVPRLRERPTAIDWRLTAEPAS